MYHVPLVLAFGEWNATKFHEEKVLYVLRKKNQQLSETNQHKQLPDTNQH